MTNKRSDTYCYRLQPDHDWNPLAQFPANAKCFCGSGKKCKRCCLHLVVRAIPKSDAQKICAMWDDLLAGKKFIVLDTVSSKISKVMHRMSHAMKGNQTL